MPELFSGQTQEDVRQRLATHVFEHSREGILITDNQHRIVMVNRAFVATTGYEEAEVLGQNTRILNSGRHDKAFFLDIWDGIANGGQWEGQMWNRRKDGTAYPGWLCIQSIRDKNNDIAYFKYISNDGSQHRIDQERIHWLANFDPLTGLPNRVMLADRAGQGIRTAQRENEPLTMMMLSIDHFKTISSTLGHRIGEQLLIEFGNRLKSAVRGQDTVARLAGEGFVLVLPETDGDGAARLASKLMDLVSSPCQIGDQVITITSSIGIAMYPGDGTDFDTLSTCIAAAMLRAQQLGRNTYQFFNTGMHRQGLERLMLANALRSAIDLEQLQLHYQPLVDLQTGQISGLEALLRWQHPDMGTVLPGSFIPVAEESGLITQIGLWVLRQACQDMRAWIDKGLRVPQVAINVSPIQFRDANFLQQIENTLSEFRIDPGLIYVEVTEGVLMEDAASSETILQSLKALGVKLSLDDFGTGYSSLSYLKRFPFDKVKIDQSFVCDLASNQSDAVIVGVIVSMAHGLGLKVVAEGVETEAQCEILRNSVCDEIQGYLFSKPVSSQSIESLLSERRQLPAHLLRFRASKRTLLLVDDEPNVVASLKRLFRRDGHIILTANSGTEGLEILSQNKVDVIISDQRMPGMTGVEFLRAAKINYPDTIRIVLSGYTELQSVTDAINEGAVYRFLTKPWEDEQLREHIQKAFEYKELLEENQQLDLRVRTKNQELVAINRQLGIVLENNHHQIERDQTSLAIVREALQHIPLPVIGTDDEGQIAFVNAAAESLFLQAGALLGVELACALPSIDAAIAGSVEGASAALVIDNTRYAVKWNTMGLSSRSRGRLVTLMKGQIDE